jgi:hypothetical protein
MGIRKFLRVIMKPLDVIIDDLNFLLNLVPEWTKDPHMDLDPTMYGTGTYKGDLDIHLKINDIIYRYGLRG